MNLQGYHADGTRTRIFIDATVHRKCFERIPNCLAHIQPELVKRHREPKVEQLTIVFKKFNTLNNTDGLHDWDMHFRLISISHCSFIRAYELCLTWHSACVPMNAGSLPQYHKITLTVGVED